MKAVAVCMLSFQVAINAYAQNPIEIQTRAVSYDDVRRLYKQGAHELARGVALQCADSGEPNCQLAAAEFLLNGVGGPRDDTKAAGYLEASSRHGSPAAQAMLGNLYVLGRGVTADPSTAIKWWTLSANSCNLWAQNALGRAFHDGDRAPQDPVLALHWVSVAAHYGHENAGLGRKRLLEAATPQVAAQARGLTDRFIQASGCGSSRPVVNHEP